jgi:hypothetical protein
VYVNHEQGSDEEIVLSYWYSVGGERAYEHQETTTVSGGESRIQTAEVPWLAANLYIMVIIAAAVVAASIAYVVYVMRTRFGKLL